MARPRNVIAVAVILGVIGYVSYEQFFALDVALARIEVRLERTTAISVTGLEAAAAKGNIPTLLMVRLDENATDADFAPLTGARSLLALECRQTKLLDGSGFRHLSHAPLEQLSMSGANGMVDAGLAAIGALRSLRELDLEGAWLVSDTGIAALAGLTELRGLRLHGAGFRSRRVTGKSLTAFAGMQHLEFLALGGFRLGGHGLAPLAKLPVLRELDLMSTHLRDDDLQTLPEFPVLEQLELMGNSELTDAAVPVLLRMTRLRYLGIHDTGITAAGVDRLAKDLPGLRLGHPSRPDDKGGLARANRPPDLVQRMVRLAEGK